MKRKVNLVGQNTLTVSLPTAWTKRNNVKKGDEVELVESMESLRISKDQTQESEKAKIDLSLGNGWYVDQQLRNMYTSGFDEIEVSFKNKEIILIIQESINKLIGFEIIAQSANQCIIKAVSDTISDNFDAILRKTFFQVDMLFKTLNESLIVNNNKNMQTIKQMHMNILKFDFLLRRMITKNNLFNERKRRSLYIILMRLSMISSNIFYIYEYLSKKKRISISQDIIKYVEKANELYNDCYQILYSKKIQNLEKINRERETLIKKNTIEFLENNKGENSVIAHYLGEIIRIITAMGGYILSYTIDTN